MEKFFDIHLTTPFAVVPLKDGGVVITIQVDREWTEVYLGFLKKFLTEWEI